MINTSKIYRSGCAPRVIFYSQSSTGHEYYYGKPIVSITGKNTRHITQNSSTERKFFTKIKHHPLPNSKRTINPEFGNIEIIKPNKTNKYIWKNSIIDSNFCVKGNKIKKPIIKISNKKNKTSEELKQDNIDNNNKEKDYINKSSYSFYIKNKYDYNSEILNLPGGSKRGVNDINDDFNKTKNYERTFNTTANCFRKRDFNNSKISCLNPFYQNKKQNIKRNNINLNDKDFCSYYYYTDENLINDNKNKISKEENKEFNDDNKYKYKAKNMRKNIFEVSKENNENCFNNNKYFSNAIFNNYIKDSFKRKNDNLITHYTRKRNVKSFNRLFNEVHEENPKYNVMKYYGKNYSRKNYSQFELN